MKHAVCMMQITSGFWRARTPFKRINQWSPKRTTTDAGTIIKGYSRTNLLNEGWRILGAVSDMNADEEVMLKPDPAWWENLPHAPSAGCSGLTSDFRTVQRHSFCCCCYTHTHIHTHTHTLTHTHTHARTHARTHTHTWNKT